MKRIILTILIFSLIFLTFDLTHKQQPIINPTSTTIIDIPTLIIDAGHGGQDCGTIANDGTYESVINLAISYKLKEFLLSFGFNVLMTRTDDNLIGDNSLGTIRERKRSDVRKRLDIVENTENPVLISIHQNYFSLPQYYGVQVFYSGNHLESKKIAQEVQSSSVNHLQKDNKRQIKLSGKEIWLLYNVKTPAIMVECGFLSNQNELNKLKDDAYQNEIAFMISIGIINYYLKI